MLAWKSLAKITLASNGIGENFSMGERDGMLGSFFTAASGVLRSRLGTPSPCLADLDKRRAGALRSQAGAGLRVIYLLGKKSYAFQFFMSGCRGEIRS